MRVLEILASVLALAALSAYLACRAFLAFQTTKDPLWQEMENRALATRWARRNR